MLIGNITKFNILDKSARVIKYAPDFVLTFPRDLTFKRLRWKEVTPQGKIDKEHFC